MFSNAAAWSACSPGDMTRQVAARARVRDFGKFDSQTTEGDTDETGLAPLPCRYSCDYGTRCLALGRGTFQPILHCKMTCSVTGQQCSGRYHACCVTEQETQDSMPVLPPNACGLPQCIQGARRETAQQKFDAVSDRALWQRTWHRRRGCHGTEQTNRHARRGS